MVTVQFPFGVFTVQEGGLTVNVPENGTVAGVGVGVAVGAASTVIPPLLPLEHAPCMDEPVGVHVTPGARHS